MKRRGALLGASLLFGTALSLHLASCADDNERGDVADAMASGDVVSAEPDVVDSGALDAANDAKDARDAPDLVDACGECASGVCSAGGCDPVVFVTSKSYTGAIGDGGIAAADEECASLAKAAARPGTFRAWLSVASGSSPLTRFTNKSTRPYRRIDGQEIAADFSKLGVTLKNTISMTEKGVEIPFSYVWTATSVAGVPTADAGDCDGWTSADPATKGGSGESDDTVDEWTAFGEVPCSTSARLYCFEQ